MTVGPWSGRYSDGRTARITPVRATVAADRLVIAGEDGTILAEWPLGSLDLAGRAAAPVRLRSEEGGDARLTLDDPAALPGLRAAGARLGGPEAGSGRTILFWTLGLAAVIGAVLLLLPQLSASIATLVPIEDEASLGDTVADSIEAMLRHPDACNGAEGRAAVDALARRLLAGQQSPYRFRVEVLDSDVPNALAAPGGRILVFRGLIDRMEDPDEFAGVLAHEMGHVLHRHGLQGIIRQQGLSILAMLTGGSDLSRLGQAGSELVALSYSRSFEREADETALRLLAGAGLRRDGLSTLFHRLAEDAGGGPAFLATHPPLEERALLDTPDTAGASAMSDAEWRAVREMCD
ncbi:M48 family metallopeptidase [Inquilinus limosus]|uniref:M48 family metallopeptidase n=1 Tax=Inquilinus limosus TaxID=171674 RepID=UPI0004178ABB|nr:M48 family metallopeptidase [Inquilinus limosus]